MKKNFLLHIIVSLVIIAVSACQDELMKEVAVGNGSASISATVDFKPMSSAIARSRSAGDALKEINSLYVLIYDQEKNLIKSYKIDNYATSDEERNDNNAENGASAESSTKQATFDLPERIEFGRYYMYAVANIPDLLTTHSDAIKTVEGLRNIPLAWNSQNVSANGQMIGCLMSGVVNMPVQEELLAVNENTVRLHAWLRRAASKVTVAFDGTGLAEGITIYFKELRIKQIPKTCLLGTDSKAGSAGDIIETGEVVTYSESTNFDENYPVQIAHDNPLYPEGKKITSDDGKTVTWEMSESAHSEYNPNSLFFYENMQGDGPDKSVISDENKDGLQDSPYTKGKEFGTYIEVDAYYVSKNPQRPGISNITYRFMLGQNITTDYNAKRNCHYKLTLHFRGFADEPDWRIDYVTKFGVSQPYDVNYQGKYFLPDNLTDNQGNNFYDVNTITVSSYRYNTEEVWGKRDLLDFSIEYRDSVDQNFRKSDFSGTVPGWLNGAIQDVTDQFPTHKNQGLKVYKINYKNEFKPVNINKLLKSRVNDKVTDLASNGTANCYIVDAKGTYTLPLVYGNAIGKGGNIDATTYSGFTGDDRVLKTFKNYNNEDITSAYILDDIGRTGTIDACIVWQDSENLISNVSYEAGAYGGKGGLSFTIGDNIAQGNAVIALKKDNVIVWSWHVWVQSKELTDRIWTVKNYLYGDYGVMPVNLGWCSLPDDDIRYYDRHKCQVRFRQILSRNDDGTSNYGSEQIVDIIQEPHISLPRGNNTYFQWGRKDPLVGTDASWTNKTWWCIDGTALVERNDDPDFLNPSLFITSYDANGKKVISDNPDGINPNKRDTSIDAIGRMIRNPQKLNNPRFSGFVIGEKSTDKDGNEIWINNERGKIDDKIYSNLWLDDKKTIYDPCPSGYKVAPVLAFTAFTTTYWPTTGINQYGYSVSQDNMLPEYRNGNMEYYVNGKRKLISITFPLTGYRDFDAGQVYWVGEDLYVWQAHNFQSISEEQDEKDYEVNNYSNFFKAYLKDTGYIGVNTGEYFYATDACSVRPVKE